jgi:hypothetical protein
MFVQFAHGDEVHTTEIVTQSTPLLQRLPVAIALASLVAAALLTGTVFLIRRRTAEADGTVSEPAQKKPKGKK